ncbi:MAG: PDDEXK nuclease domain-containing protein [Bacteroidales bacterium]|nr:PDDEXK nuclease domain-containing protein [Bacteroidales bacterium]
MNFDILINQVEQTHTYLQQNTLTAVNINLTMRNWLIGFYIVEFEQQGSDRAAYGERLLEKMAARLSHIRGLSNRNLNYFRLFYLSYPHFTQLFTNSDSINVKPLKMVIQGIVEYLNQKGQIPAAKIVEAYYQIMQTPSAKSQSPENSILQMPSAKFQKNENLLTVPSEKLISLLSFSHFIEIIRIGDPLKKTFYEIEAIKGNWSVKQLQRQINTLLFERTGLSKNKAEVLSQANIDAETLDMENSIRNPYFFEFLGLKDKDTVSESDLETALLNHLQEFILELGEGFCFEARQKRISIGSKYYHIDLVFYHRILKCHVLIDLKINEADYSDITQLNTYVSYYRKNMMQVGDKPSVGILLCTSKDEAFVEYALAGLDEKIFISQYLLHIPAKKTLEKFVKSEIDNFN